MDGLYRYLTDIKTKLLCSCKADGEGSCSFCRRQDGALPFINKAAVELLVKLAADLEVPLISEVGFYRVLTGEALSERAYFVRSSNVVPDEKGMLFLEEGINGEAIIASSFALSLAVYNAPPRPILGKIPNGDLPKVKLAESKK